MLPPSLSPRLAPQILALVLVLLSMAGHQLRAAAESPSTRVGHASATRVAAGAAAAEAWSSSSLGDIDPRVFKLALGAASCAVRTGDVSDLTTLTVIDYSRPSTRKRLWVFDLRTRALLYEELVAHGQGSGDNMARAFSNEPETHQSSIGVFRTEDTYVGRNGYSLRLRGLDGQFNDRAYERAIVMHGAPYVSDEVVRAQGRLGRSWGCPALRSGIAREVIDTVKGHGLIVAYYPDPAWLESSKYLGDCASDE